MAIVMTKKFPGCIVNIHDDCIIKDEAEIQRRLNICAEIVYGSLRRQMRENQDEQPADAV